MGLTAKPLWLQHIYFGRGGGGGGGGFHIGHGRHSGHGAVVAVVVVVAVVMVVIVIEAISIVHSYLSSWYNQRGQNRRGSCGVAAPVPRLPRVIK